VDAEATADIVAVLWSKLVFISATSAVGAAVRVPIDVFRALGETRALLVAAMEETIAVARARGVALPPELLDRTLAFVDSLPAGTTSSMQRDVMAGRPSELDAQCGAVVRLGREARVPTPVNEVLHAALMPQERAARQAAGVAFV
jgi:2-dehydropantoate 2-reductase